MTRQVLPQRRKAETFDLDFGGLKRAHTVTIGFYDNGAVGEVFINGGKSGEHVEAMARDAAVVLSIALQFGANLEDIKKAITRDGQDDAQSIIGVVVDRLAKFLGDTTEGSDGERSTRPNPHEHERTPETTDTPAG